MVVIMENVLESDYLVLLVKKLIACKSVTPKDDGALSFLIDILSDIGFTCDRQTFHEEGTFSIDNLYAKIGAGSRNLCFAGHTDVVPVGNESNWSYPPFEACVVDGILYGRGAVDMKSSVIAFIVAVSEYLKNNSLKDNDAISLLITGDEESVSINGTQKMLGYLQSKNEVIKACLVGEPSSAVTFGDTVKIGRRGSLCVKLTCKGVLGHVAYPHLANNAANKIVQILSELKGKIWDSGTENFQATNLEITNITVPNKATNVVPDIAQADFNIRFNDLHSFDSLERDIREICEKYKDSDSEYDLKLRHAADVFVHKPSELSNYIQMAVQDVTKIKPELTTGGGTSDARFIKNYCPVVEFGPLCTTAHHVDENIPVDHLVKLKNVYKRFWSVILHE